MHLVENRLFLFTKSDANTRQTFELSETFPPSGLVFATGKQNMRVIFYLLYGNAEKCLERLCIREMEIFFPCVNKVTETVVKCNIIHCKNVFVSN